MSLALGHSLWVRATSSENLYGVIKFKCAGPPPLLVNSRIALLAFTSHVQKSSSQSIKGSSKLTLHVSFGGQVLSVTCAKRCPVLQVG